MGPARTPGYFGLNHWPYVTLFYDPRTVLCQGSYWFLLQILWNRRALLSLNHVFNIHLYHVIENRANQNTKVDGHPVVLYPAFLSIMHQAYTCQQSCIMHESHACRSKIVISRIQTNFSCLTDNSKCNCLKTD